MPLGLDASEAAGSGPTADVTAIVPVPNEAADIHAVAAMRPQELSGRAMNLAWGSGFLVGSVRFGVPLGAIRSTLRVR